MRPENSGPTPDRDDSPCLREGEALPIRRLVGEALGHGNGFQLPARPVGGRGEDQGFLPPS